MNQDAKVLKAPTELTLQNRPHSVIVYLSGDTLYFPAQNLLSPVGCTNARERAKNLPLKYLAISKICIGNQIASSKAYLVTIEGALELLAGFKDNPIASEIASFITSISIPTECAQAIEENKLLHEEVRKLTIQLRDSHIQNYVGSAVVVGASRGIGHAILTRIAQENPHLAVLAVSRTFSAPPALSNITQLATDMSSPEAPELIASSLQFPVKYLVYAAGILGPNWSTALPPSEFDRIMSVNARSAYYLCLGLSQKFSAESRVLFINSLGGYEYIIRSPIYCISKAALHMIYQVLKSELAPIGVGIVMPGIVDTEMYREAKHNDSNFGVGFAQEKIMSPEYNAHFLWYLLSESLGNEEFSSQVWDVYDTAHHCRWVPPGLPAPEFPNK